MRFARAGAEILHPTRDAVVKAGTNVDHQIAAVHRQVGLIGAVHPQHPQPGLTGRRISPQTHQGRSDGKAGGGHEIAQGVRCGEA